MKSELNNVRNPYRIYFFWGAFYSLVIALLVIGFIFFAGRIKTHTLPSGSIKLDVPYSKYLLGEPVTFTIKNNYNSSVYVVNNCPTEPLEVYRLEKNKWVRLHDKVSISECENEPRIINVPAKGVVNGSFEPWKHLFNKVGKYRIVAFVEYYNELPYKDIEVVTVPKPKKPAANTSTTSQGSNTTAPTITPESTANSDNANNELESYTPKKSKTISVSSGSISVQYDNTTVYVISIAPAAGCTYEGGNSGTQVEVTFKCSGSETQIQLWVSGGQLVTKVESGG